LAVCLTSYTVPPTSPGRRACAQTLTGPEVILRGPLLYGVVRARVGFPIQSGPLFFAPYPGRWRTWPFSAPAVRPATTTSRVRPGEASRVTPGPCWPPSPHRSCKPGGASRAGTAPTGGFGSGWVRPGPPGRSLHVNPDRRHLPGPPEPPRASEAGHQTRRGRGCGQVQPWSPLYIYFFHMHNPHGP
jgi:hypothetical protein